MKKVCVCTALLVFVISMLCAQNSVFKFNEDKMDVGSLYTYTIQELAGHKKMNFYYYIKDPQTILCYIDFSTVIPQVFIIEAKLDTAVCGFKSTTGYNPFSYMKLTNSNDISTCVYDYSKMTIDMSMSYFDGSHKLKKMSSRKKLPMSPTYEMSLYQLDFWFAMRCLKSGVKKFQVGSFNGLSLTTSDVVYRGEEKIDGVLCTKWEISQKGIIAKMTKQKQTVWFDKGDKYFKVVRYVNTANVSPVGQLDINFVSKKQMTTEDWDCFVITKNEEARIRLGLPKKGQNEKK